MSTAIALTTRTDKTTANTAGHRPATPTDFLFLAFRMVERRIISQLPQLLEKNKRSRYFSLGHSERTRPCLLDSRRRQTMEKMLPATAATGATGVRSFNITSRLCSMLIFPYQSTHCRVVNTEMCRGKPGQTPQASLPGLRLTGRCPPAHPLAR